jgi:uncharacterized protein YkwD
VDPAPVPQLHARRLAALFVAALAFAQVAAAANPEVLNALNAIRARGCAGRPGVAPPFHESAQLSDAAKRSMSLAFSDALAASGYRANRSLLIRIGATGTQSIASFLANEYCAHLVDGAYAEIGVYQQPRETRIILAAPFMAPPAEAAPAIAIRVLQLVNQARERSRTCGSSRFAAARPVSLSDTLSRVSLAHAVEMAQYSRFAHEGRDGSSAADRATRAGYNWKTVGENIAAGQTTPETVVEGWLKSPQHCANLMAPQFREMGVAFAVNNASEAGIYWVQLFGARR